MNEFAETRCVSADRPTSLSRGWVFDAFPADAPLLMPALVSLVADELARQRGRMVPRAEWTAWGPDTSLEGQIGADSLARLGLVERVNRFFGLDRVALEDYLLLSETLGEWCDLAVRAVEDTEQDAPSITFRTSGSSGAPTWHRHGCQALGSEVACHARCFADARRVVVLVPPHHIFGFLFGVLLPRALGIDVVHLRGLSPSRIGRALERGDLLVGTPFLLGQLVDHAVGLPPEVSAVTSGSAAPRQLWENLRECGAERIVEVYGSTETGGIAMRTVADAPFQLLGHRVEARRRSGAGPEEPLSATAEKVLAEVAGAMPDRIERLGGGRFRLIGRRDKAVQIGGVNVYPERVRRVLINHPAVADCAVSRKGPEGAERLEALLVPADRLPEAAFLASVRAYVAEQLTPPERPATLHRCRSLPRTADWKLSAETG